MIFSKISILTEKLPIKSQKEMFENQRSMLLVVNDSCVFGHQCTVIT